MRRLQRIQFSYVSEGKKKEISSLVIIAIVITPNYYIHKLSNND